MIKQKLNFNPDRSNNRMLDTITNNQPRNGNFNKTVTTEKYTEDEYSFMYILRIMAQIGGFYTFLNLIIGSILSVFTYNSYMINIINRYNQRSSKDILKSYSHKPSLFEKRHSNRVHNLEFDDEEDKEQISFTKLNKFHEKANARDNNKETPHLFEEGGEPISHENSIKHTKQPDIVYNSCDVLYQSLWCLKRKKFSEDPDAHKYLFNDRYLQYKVDLDKFYKECDCINILFAIKQLKRAINDMVIK